MSLSENQAQPQFAPYPRPSMIQCRICGSVPAAQVTFRGHRGLVVLMQFRSAEGPFCRDCGLSVFRTLTAQTLLQGWWGVMSMFITPITLLVSASRRQIVARLAPPMPPPFGEYRRPADPGRPVYARPTAILGAALPVIILLYFMAGAVTH
jgi:hypothetical protein